MVKQKGFTLIELIVVIIIIGILSVTALPRMMNLQKDARRASLQGLKGALQGSMLMVYGKAAIASLETLSKGSISVEDTTIAIAFGMPAATSNGIIAALQNNNDFDDGTNASFAIGATDWVYAHVDGTDTTAGTISITFNNVSLAGTGRSENEIQAQNCYVQYIEARSDVAAQVTMVDTGAACIRE